jgi:hypothetical protein
MKNGFNAKLKNEGALKKRFFRHDGIYRSDVSSLLVNLGRGPAIRSGPGQAIGRAGKYTPCPSSAMSSVRLFLNRLVATRAHLLFTGTTRLNPLPLSAEAFIIER